MRTFLRVVILFFDATYCDVVSPHPRGIAHASVHARVPDVPVDTPSLPLPTVALQTLCRGRRRLARSIQRLCAGIATAAAASSSRAVANAVTKRACL